MTEGAQQTSSDKTAIREFQVNVPEAELTELRRRINATRWPERETVTDDSQGVYRQHLSCSAFTPTCPAPPQPPSTPRSSAATRRHRICPPRSDARTSSVAPSTPGTWPTRRS